MTPIQIHHESPRKHFFPVATESEYNTTDMAAPIALSAEQGNRVKEI
jgi:hypothetical protein